MERDRWLGIEVRHLAAVQAVAEEGSFGRAAARLGYTQSAVSQQIAALERAVGVRLVERPGGPRPVSLTDAGTLLVGHARSIVSRLAAAKADLDALSHGEAGTLRVGIYQSAGARILPRLLQRFLAEWPRVTVRLNEAGDEDLLPLVERGELDLSFVTFPVAEGPFETVELLRDPFVLLVHADSELAKRDTQPGLRDLRGLPLIAWRTEPLVEGRLRVRGVEPDIVFRSDDNGIIHGLVAAGFGAALMPRLAVDPNDTGVVALELATAITPRMVGLAWHRDRYRSPAALAFVETALVVCAEIDEERAAAA
jgi:DNA-binding transcriptional LysR family regulator